MKAKIIITGEINSVSTILNALNTDNAEVKKLQYNNKCVEFETKREAVKSLSKAFQKLSSDKEDWNNSTASYKYSSSISYDAATASIYNELV